MFTFNDIPGWCAAVKVSGVTDYRANKFFAEIDDVYRRAVMYHAASVIVVSVNESEEYVIEVLKKLRFKKTAWVKNYLHHNGRRTCLFIKQIPYKFIPYHFK